MNLVKRLIIKPLKVFGNIKKLSMFLNNCDVVLDKNDNLILKVDKSVLINSKKSFMINADDYILVNSVNRVVDINIDFDISKLLEGSDSAEELSSKLEHTSDVRNLELVSEEIRKQTQKGIFNKELIEVETNLMKKIELWRNENGSDKGIER